MVETDNCENDKATSQEQISPCQSIKDLSITQIKYSGCMIGDNYAGVSLIIRNDLEITKTEEIHKGRIIKIECKNKATQTVYNIVGFYGFPSSWNKNVRKSLIHKLDSALSNEITN